MTLLNDADAIYLGSTPVDRIYAGAALVWPPVPSGPWTPAEIATGMYSWWDASVASSLSFSGANLTQWRDLSAAANHLNLATFAAAGATLTTINGLGSLLFNDSGMKTAGVSTFNDFTVFAAFTPASTRWPYERVLDHDFADSFWIGRQGGVDLEATENWGGGFAEMTPPYGRFALLPDSTTHQISIQRAGTTHTVSGNGGASLQTGTVSGATSGSQEMTVGDDIGGQSFLHGSSISEILIWSRSLATDEKAKTEGYLAHKWGLQAKLPAGHPYKSAPPSMRGSL